MKELNSRKLANDLTEMFSGYLYRIEYPTIVIQDFASTVALSRARYRDDIYFHLKVDMLVSHVLHAVFEAYE